MEVKCYWTKKWKRLWKREMGFKESFSESLEVPWTYCRILGLMSELPVWAQQKVRKILWDTEGKGIPVMQWNKVLQQCHMQLCEKQNTCLTDWVIYLRRILNKVLKVSSPGSFSPATTRPTWFPLNAYSKTRRKKLREGLLNKRTFRT